MGSLSLLGAMVIGVVVGTCFTIIALALVRKPSNFTSCPLCEEQEKEKTQLKEEWENQQKGYK
jgi:hypothetical protein